MVLPIRRFFSQVTVLLCAVSLQLGLTGCCLFPGNGGEDTQAFTLAYADEGSAKIRVRYSQNGLSWRSGNFPAEILAGGGVGAASDDRGILQIIGWNDSGTIRLIQGLGAANWSQTPIAATPEEQALSSPAICFLGEGIWLVAFRSPDIEPDSGNRVVARLFDTSTSPPRFLTDNVTPGPMFSNLRVVGQPAAVALNGEVWLAWVTDNNRTRLVQGSFANGELSWDAGEELTFPDVHCRPTASAPAFTHDHESIFLAHLCQDPAPVTNYVLNILRREGSGWQQVAQRYGLPVNASIEIAGQAPDILISAWVGTNYGQPDNAGAALYQDETWTALAAEEVFGDAPRTPFALIRTGRPAF